MNREEKLCALLSVAEAYLDRGTSLQYDQRAMDRIIQLTQRRQKSLPPEAATEQYTLFLDCSSFIFTVYREAFGYEMPSDLTWHMIDLVEPRIYFYTVTGEETEEDKERVCDEILSTLAAGDVLTYDRHQGSGHTMLYLGDNVLAHSTTNGRPDSYDYVNKRSREYECGVRRDKADKIVRERLFPANGNVRRIAISRPLNTVGDPTPNTLARMGTARGVRCEVTASHHGGRHAQRGETVEYTVKTRAKYATELYLTFDAPRGTELIGVSEYRATIDAGEEKSFSFAVRVAEDVGSLYIDGPRVTANGLSVYTHRVYLSTPLTESEKAKTDKAIKDSSVLSKSALSAAAAAYRDICIDVPDTELSVIRSSFFMYDSTGGDLLYRKRQVPGEDGALYAIFGGTGVTTPENSSDPYIRTAKPRVSDLRLGDIIVCCDNAYGTAAYSSYYDGECLYGKFEHGGEFARLTAEKAAEFVDSLLGRFCFIVLRPSLKRR